MLSLFRQTNQFKISSYEVPFLWLLNHSDTKGEYDYGVINKNIISGFPAFVKKAMGTKS